MAHSENDLWDIDDKLFTNFDKVKKSKGTRPPQQMMLVVLPTTHKSHISTAIISHLCHNKKKQVYDFPPPPDIPSGYHYLNVKT